MAFVGLAAARDAHATQPLEDFIERAKSRSFDAREIDATKRQRDAEADMALSRLIPTFSARGVYTRNQYEAAITNPGPPPTKIVIIPNDQLDAYLQLDVPIVDLSSYYRYRAAKAVARTTNAQQEAVHVEVSRSVARAYYQLVGAAAVARAARESVKVAEQNAHNVEERKGAGVGTDLDIERARANVERAKQDVADADLMVSISMRQLETASGLTPTDATPLPPDDLHEEAPFARWAALVNDTPANRAAREATVAAYENKRAISTEILPKLTGIAQQRFTNATGFQQRDSIYTLQIVLSWRIDYSVLSANTAYEGAREAQAIREEKSRRALEDAVFEAHRRVEAGIVKCRSARAQAAAATRAASLAADRYGAGVATQLDVTQAQRDAFLAEAGRIQADADLAFARAGLRLAAGRAPNDRRNP